MRRSTMLCMWFVSVLPLVALRADDVGPSSLLVTGVFADPSIVAPMAWYRHDDQNGRAYRVGVSGWTMEGEWTRRRSPMHSLLFAADATPMNTHNSDRTYEEGERTEERDTRMPLTESVEASGCTRARTRTSTCLWSGSTNP